MSISWLITNTLAAFLLPPLSLVLLGLLGLWLARRYRRLGYALCALPVLLLLFLSTAAGSRLLIRPLEQSFIHLPDPKLSTAQAIVILGGGRLFAAPEYGGLDQPSGETLLRLRHGARLQRLTGLPLLVSGGAPDGSGETEASVMARSLKEDFKVPVQWVEDSAENTLQNARLSALKLKQAKISRVLLVTDALHMQRASLIFHQAGLAVVPAPTAFRSTRPASLADFIPNAHELRYSHYALHEWMGLLWYQLRYRLFD